MAGFIANGATFLRESPKQFQKYSFGLGIARELFERSGFRFEDEYMIFPTQRRGRSNRPVVRFHEFELAQGFIRLDAAVSRQHREAQGYLWVSARWCGSL
jgi:hypothetical protein